jgi:hypothetical protein
LILKIEISRVSSIFMFDFIGDDKKRPAREHMFSVLELYSGPNERLGVKSSDVVHRPISQPE